MCRCPGVPLPPGLACPGQALVTLLLALSPAQRRTCSQLAWEGPRRSGRPPLRPRQSSRAASSRKGCVKGSLTQDGFDDPPKPNPSSETGKGQGSELGPDPLVSVLGKQPGSSHPFPNTCSVPGPVRSARQSPSWYPEHPAGQIPSQNLLINRISDTQSQQQQLSLAAGTCQSPWREHLHCGREGCRAQ